MQTPSTDDAGSSLPPARDILGCAVRPLTVGAFVEDVLTCAAQGTRRRVAYLNAHTSNLAGRRSDFRRLLERADVVYADGQAVVWASRLLGRPLPERVNAGDFVQEFCAEAARRGVSLYLLGGRAGVARAAADAWAAKVPGLKIAGLHDGFFREEDAPAVARDIAASGARVVLAGMGSPRQEEWMLEWGDETGAPVIWCVGALFEYFGEGRPRAPWWMRRCGLEWAFRLAVEPRRLWRRYLLGNPVFLLRLACAMARGGRS